MRDSTSVKEILLLRKEKKSHFFLIIFRHVFMWHLSEYITLYHNSYCVYNSFSIFHYQLCVYYLVTPNEMIIIIINIIIIHI